MSSKVILVTGASSGLGRAMAAHLARAGHRVYGTSRRAPPVASADTDGVHMLAMDVCSDDSVAQAVQQLLARERRIDVLVNNAGDGIAGSIENTSLEEAKAQFETNFFGVLRTCRAVLPAMRTQRDGLIVNVSSMAGLLSIPFQGLYSASKFAVEGATEALRAEVAPLGVRVVLLEPGDFATGFTAQRRVTAAADDPAYRARFRAALGVMEADERGGADPALVGPALERIIAARAPRLRWLVGSAKQRFEVGLLRHLVPEGFVLDSVAKRYKVR